jgi:hypothetical protein
MGRRKVHSVQENVKTGRVSPCPAAPPGRERKPVDYRAAQTGNPYSTLPIFFTAAISRAESSATNFENSGASK